MKKGEYTHEDQTNFSDMDGTLLNTHGRITASNAKLIKDAGIPITLVSARAPMEMQEAINDLNLSGLQVAFNGGLIFKMNNGKMLPLHTEIIPQDSANLLLEVIYRDFPQVSLSYYDLNHWYCATIDEGIRYEFNLTKCAPTLVNDIERFLIAPLNTFKIMLITFDEQTMQNLQNDLLALDLNTITIQRSGKFYLEITNRHAKKSKGISYILKKEGLKKEQTAAFGDGHNDLPRLEMVGYPIVMANAFADIKKVAYKLTKSNQEDGVGYGIHTYLKGS